ncbi:MAG: type II toxin-antitoxin system VapC family toxin [Thermoleophilaceae bacterium]|nr:type II toxin-antitoxin system VapC family toxin [Thermoleophilaceae bacterium]
MIVLDTTVLMYAKGGTHPLRDPCREIVAAVGDGRIEATTTPEVIQEFAHVWTRRRNRAEAATLGMSYGQLLSPLLPVTGETLAQGLTLFGEAERLDAFDCVLAATAIASAATALVSADRAFADVAGIEHLLPDEVL